MQLPEILFAGAQTQYRGYLLHLSLGADLKLGAIDLMALDIRVSLKTTSNVIQFRRKKETR